MALRIADMRKHVSTCCGKLLLVACGDAGICYFFCSACEKPCSSSPSDAQNEGMTPRKTYQEKYDLSSCCKAGLFVTYGQEGTNSYRCRGCEKPCDAVPDTEDTPDPVQDAYDTLRMKTDEDLVRDYFDLEDQKFFSAAENLREIDRKQKWIKREVGPAMIAVQKCYKQLHDVEKQLEQEISSTQKAFTVIAVLMGIHGSATVLNIIFG